MDRSLGVRHVAENARKITAMLNKSNPYPLEINAFGRGYLLRDQPGCDL